MDILDRIYERMFVDLDPLARQYGYTLSLMLTPDERGLPLVRASATFRRGADDLVELATMAWLDPSVEVAPITEDVLLNNLRIAFAARAKLPVPADGRVTLVVTRNADQFETYAGTFSRARRESMRPAFRLDQIRGLRPEQIRRVEFVGEYWQSPLYIENLDELHRLEQAVNGRIVHT